jgi:A/G-specific adenine glycosylase
LLRWFRSRQRDVPWRGATDPYRIWVAEVMAQQTRMETVRGYYERFLSRFPDVHSLAASNLDDVLKCWEGLGYYARARNLHRAARRLVTDHAGEFPADPSALRALPGIGAYTAGAIASIAFGLPEPAVDGNARRVLSRLFDIERPTSASLEDVARGLLSEEPQRAAEINQALMDLGGAVCTPRNPDCSACPVSGSCAALAHGTVDQRPPRRQRGPIPHHEVAVGVVQRNGRVLIARRPEEGLLGGLWEFPGGKIEPDETRAEAMVRELREEMAIVVAAGKLIERVEHAYSHFRITLYAFDARLLRGTPRPRHATAWTWATLAELSEYAFPAANQRVLDAVRANRV